ncbi:acyltransferase family protein [Nocardioides sp. TF02-7]|uniref:acyltransferase family protein n=1 Tax=Nocardioides sp. TF02-7 TaxID=2917724 RepID=UPI001F06898B|nr:acyltransferase family protein [Nocardioides sp. TF02-7]UMG94239.1 acyltransferase [Nocardioides sp. TF02-7]
MTTAPADGPGTAAPPGRRAELDALRALVVVGLVFFHSALVFDTEDDFYVKNDGTVPLAVAAGPVVVWAMPLLFLIAGFGARQSLRGRGPGGFAAERVRRLGVPLVLGLVVLVPFPQWLRARAADPGYDESYLRFYPRFWEVGLDLADFPFVLDGEHFETGHLWFLVLLLTFALLVALPAALLSRRWRDGAGRVAAAVESRPALVLLAAVPPALVSAVLGLEEQFGAWHRWAYLVFFCYGFVLGDRRIRAAVRRVAPTAAWLAVALFALSGPAFVLADDPFTDLTPLAIAGRACFGASGWCAVVAILGLLDRSRGAAGGPDRPAGRRPGRTGRVAAYLSPAVLPLYVLHQPVVVAVAYVVVGWELPGPLKYAVIVAGSLALTVAAYDLLVRRTAPTRFLLGMR